MASGPSSKNALATMRDFFKTMKGNKEIGAGVEFKKWLEDGTSITAGMNESAKPRVMTESTMPKPRVTPKARKEAAPLVTENLEPPVTPPPMETMASAMGDAPPERPGTSSHWIQDPRDEKGRWNLGQYEGIRSSPGRMASACMIPGITGLPRIHLKGRRHGLKCRLRKSPPLAKLLLPTEAPVAAPGEGLAPGDPVPLKPGDEEHLTMGQQAKEMGASVEEVAGAKEMLEKVTSARKIMGVREMIRLKREQPREPLRRFGT